MNTTNIETEFTEQTKQKVVVGSGAEEDKSGSGGGNVKTRTLVSSYADHVSRAVDYAVRDQSLVSVRTDGLSGGRRLGFKTKEILKQLVSEKPRSRAELLQIDRVWKLLVQITGNTMSNLSVPEGSESVETVKEERHSAAICHLPELGYSGFRMLESGEDKEKWRTMVRLETCEISNVAKTERKMNEELADAMQYLRAQKADTTYSRVHQADSETWALRRAQFHGIAAWADRYYSQMLEVLGLMRGVYMNKGIGLWYDVEHNAEVVRKKMYDKEYKVTGSKKVMIVSEADLLALNCSMGGAKQGAFKQGHGGFYSVADGIERTNRYITWVTSADLHNPAFVAGLVDLLLGDVADRHESDWAGRVSFPFDELVFAVVGRDYGRVTIGDGFEVTEGKWYAAKDIIDVVRSGSGWVENGGGGLWHSLDYRQAMHFWAGNMIQFSRAQTRAEKELDVSKVEAPAEEESKYPIMDRPGGHLKERQAAAAGKQAEDAEDLKLEDEKRKDVKVGKRRMCKWWEFLARDDSSIAESTSRVSAYMSDTWVRWSVITGYQYVVGNEFGGFASVDGQRLLAGAKAMSGCLGAICDMIAQSAGIPMGGRCSDVEMEAGKLALACQLGEVLASSLIGGYNDASQYRFNAGADYLDSCVPSGWRPNKLWDVVDIAKKSFIVDAYNPYWIVCLRAWWPLACGGAWYETDKETIRHADSVFRGGLEADGLKVSASGVLKKETRDLVLADPFLSGLHAYEGDESVTYDSHLFAHFGGIGEKRAIIGASVVLGGGKRLGVPCLLPQKSHGYDLGYEISGLDVTSTKARLTRVRQAEMVVRTGGWYAPASNLTYYADADMDFF
jgi:hypothetical protein